MKQISLTNRYLKLTFLGYLVSILIVAVSIWFASAPALQEMQEDAHRAHLDAQARVVADILDDLVDEAAYIARDPDLVAFSLGESARELRVKDLLLGYKANASIRIIDYRGRDLLWQDHLNSRSRFLPSAALSDFNDMLAGRLEPRPRIDYRPTKSETTAAFLITVPIVSQGLVEALMAIETQVDLESVLSATDSLPQTRLLTPFQAENWSDWSEQGAKPVIAQMKDASFFVTVDTNQQELQTVGRKLVVTGISVATIALILPFGLMAISGMRAIVRPHKDLQRSQRALSEKQKELAELAQIAEMANESIIVTDEHEAIIWVNSAFTRTTGYSQEEAVGKKPGLLLQGPDTDLEAKAKLRQAIQNREPHQTEILNYSKTGEPYWIRLSISPIKSFNDEENRFAAIATDISEVKNSQEVLERVQKETEHQALHDSLTGLPNRRHIDDILEHMVATDDSPRTLIRIDLDHFKNVNDTLGHAAGDFVLCEVAKCLRRNVRGNDVAARVGGDEFVILLAQDASPDDAELLTERLRQEIRKEMDFEGNSCRIGASFGIATGGTGLITNSELLMGADAALYVAKDTGRNTTVVYSPEVHTSVLEKRLISRQIETGLENSEFEACFQPQFDASTEELVGVEALVRWNHPTRGLLTPDCFLDVADQLRFTPDIDRQVFEFGINCIEKLNSNDRFIPKISFNVGVHQIKSPDFLNIDVSHRIGKTRISLEVLESVLIEEQEVSFLWQVDAMRERGFSIEVDDFGSGHASVIGLQKLMPDVVKLDRLLVQPMDRDVTARSIVKNMIDIGKALGISVTAEGVETAEHAAILKDLGCNTLQGFFFAKPMSFSDLKRFVTESYDEKLAKVTSLAVRRDQA